MLQKFMLPGINVDVLEHIEDPYEHVFELFTIRAENESENLGFVDRSNQELNVLLDNAGVDLTIRQSLTSLSSTKQTSSTGFVCWKTTLWLTDWMLGSITCPLYPIFQEKNDLVVLELGAGIAGICASTLGPKCSRYIATDQKHILKLLRENFERNTNPHKYVWSSNTRSSKKNDDRAVIDIVEYDWEYLEDGLQNYTMLETPRMPDLIIACDTIYNEYLIPHFVAACKQLMDKSTTVLIGLQLREPDVIEHFIQELLDQELQVFSVPTELLGEKLIHGFAVYFITL